MSREIKFRVWDSVKNEMIRNDLICKLGLFGLAFIPSSDTKPMQYTGLKDKNGVEIYEGDIVKRISMQPFTTELTGNVIMFDGCWYIDGGEDGIPLFNEVDENLVIGNIYENPELLEAE